MTAAVVLGSGGFGSSAAVGLDLGTRGFVTPAALPRNGRSVLSAVEVAEGQRRYPLGIT